MYFTRWNQFLTILLILDLIFRGKYHIFQWLSHLYRRSKRHCYSFRNRLHKSRRRLVFIVTLIGFLVILVFISFYFDLHLQYLGKFSFVIFELRWNVRSDWSRHLFYLFFLQRNIHNLLLLKLLFLLSKFFLSSP